MREGVRRKLLRGIVRKEYEVKVRWRVEMGERREEKDRADEKQEKATSRVGREEIWDENEVGENKRGRKKRIYKEAADRGWEHEVKKMTDGERRGRQ